MKSKHEVDLFLIYQLALTWGVNFVLRNWRVFKLKTLIWPDSGQVLGRSILEAMFCGSSESAKK